MKKILLTAVIFLILSVGYAQDTLLGIDLSYANEMNDCGADYFENGVEKDVYRIFRDHQADIVRIRLWHTPDSTNYSTFADIKRSISRAKEVGMKVLLDFHYSDTWADPSKQSRPIAWSGITDINILSDSLYNYTFKVLTDLNVERLLPEYVQIGNETNGNIVVETGEPLYPPDWPRNVQLFKSGIMAVKAVSNEIQTVIHIADPLQAAWWFNSAFENDLNNFDIIGLSYYPQWHNPDIQQVGTIIQSLESSFNKPVWIVETGYPWTLDNNDDAGNILGEASVLPGYANPPTTNSQKNFLINLTYEVIKNGGLGVIYWEPAWVSTSCSTQWGTGSHYENATFFNFDNQLNEGIGFLTYDYTQAPSTTSQVTFYVDMTGIDISEDVFVTGDFTGEAWQFMPMTAMGNNIYKYSTILQKGSEGAYIFTKKADWDMTLYHEQIPLECALYWGTHRKFSIEDDLETFAFVWSSCQTLPLGIDEENSSRLLTAFPNPFRDSLTLRCQNPKSYTVRVISADGQVMFVKEKTNSVFHTNSWPSGSNIIQLLNTFGEVVDNVKVVKL